MRPTYQSDTDLEGQREVATLLSHKWNCKLEELPAFNSADYVVYDTKGEPVAVLEIKVRQCHVHTYQTFMLDRKKIDNCLATAKLFGGKFILAVKWKAGVVGWIEITPDLVDVSEKGKNGRTDRNDPMDYADVVYFPINAFKIIQRPENTAVIYDLSAEE